MYDEEKKERIFKSIEEMHYIKYNLKYYTESILKNEKKEHTKHLLSKKNLEQQEDLTTYSSFFDFAHLYPSVIIQDDVELIEDEVIDDQVNK